MLQLRTYQQEVVEQVQDRDMVVMPTGTGKSAVIAAVASKFSGKSVLVVVPTVELKSQLTDVLRKWGVKTEVMVWKSASTMKHDVWLHDECHHSAAASWDKLVTGNPNAVHIGFTATPLRLDGKPLKGFSRLVEPRPIGWYMDNGYLCPKLREFTIDLGIDALDMVDLDCQFAALDKRTIYGGIVENYLKLAPQQRRAIVFATTVEHCYKVSDAFKRAGVVSEVIHNGQPAKERRALMQRFRDGEIEQLVNVYLLGEGVDVPDVNTVVMLRATESTAMYYQWVGRALRAGKKEAFILDYVGNVLRHGSVGHNLGWKDIYEEALQTEIVEKSYICVCANCGEVLRYPGQTCPVCGHKQQKLAKARTLPKERQGELKELALTPFTVEIMRAIKKVDPIEGANWLVSRKSLYSKNDSVVLMQYLTRWLDRQLALYYFNEITG